MIEITAKELYDIYMHLPMPESWLANYGDKKIAIALQPKI